MKTKGKSANTHDETMERKEASTEAGDFHAKRMRREAKIEIGKAASSQPTGTDEYQQSIAEDASFNTKPMIEKAAYFLAEQRGFAPGRELSDWLQAESKVESLLRKSVAVAPTLQAVQQEGD